MRVLVCGGRDYRDKDALFAALDYWHARLKITLLIEGGQVSFDPAEHGMPVSKRQKWGADYFAKLWAMSRCIPFVEEAVSDADWKRDGRAAGPMRNRRMLQKHKPERLIAFPGRSGTEDMLDQARRAGVRCIEVA